MNGIRKYLIWVIAGIFVVFAAVCIIVAYNVGISLHMHDYGIEGDKALQEENYFRAEEYFERARNVDSDKNTKCQYQMAVEYCNTGQLDKAEELLYSLDGKQKDVLGDMIFRMYLEKDQLYDHTQIFCFRREQRFYVHHIPIRKCWGLSDCLDGKRFRKNPRECKNAAFGR